MTEHWPLYAALALIGAMLLVLGMLGGKIRNNWPMSEPLVAVAVGIGLGPLGLDIMHLSPGTQVANGIVLEGARVTLAIAVLNAAVRLPRHYLREHWQAIAVVLGPGMLMMWGVSALIAWASLGQGLVGAILIGAIISPTDPVLASAIANSRLAESRVPESLRRLISAESGANDGLAYLFVMPPLLLMTMPLDAMAGEWLVHVLLWEVAGSVVAGLAAGWLVARVLDWSHGRDTIEPDAMLSIGIACAVAVLGAVRLVGGDGILAAFVAGLMLNNSVIGGAENVRSAQSAIGRMFELPMFVLFGAMLPWSEWFALGWPALAFVGATLLLRRLPAWFALQAVARPYRDWHDTWLAGWFGPIGISSLFYAAMVVDRTGDGEIWSITSLLVAASIAVYGVTATPTVLRFTGEEDGRAGEPSESR